MAVRRISARTPVLPIEERQSCDLQFHGRIHIPFAMDRRSGERNQLEQVLSGLLVGWINAGWRDLDNDALRGVVVCLLRELDVPIAVARRWLLDLVPADERCEMV